MKLGFQFVPFPRDIWERPIHLTGQEYQLLGWFLCDLKLGVTAASYTDKQILNGCNTKPGVDLSRNAFKTARQSLIEKGFMEAYKEHEVWTYRLLLVSITDTEIQKSVSITDTAIKEVDVDVDIESTKAQAPFVLTSEKTSEIPEWIPLESWNSFVAMRKKMRKPLTEYAVLLVIKKLQRLRDSGHNAREILDTSVERGWSSVYEPQNGNGNGKAQTESRTQRILRRLNEQDAGQLSSD